LDVQGRIVIASYPQRAKSVNIARRPHASVVVLSDEFNGPYVQIDGAAEMISLPDAVEPLVDYYRAIAGEHSDWDEYRQAMIDQAKCLIRVTLTRWGPIATGGFPPKT
jgi:PPOX class probable F420-dependent enzyme